MKTKIFAAVLAALSLSAVAMPASAQVFRGYDQFHTDWRRSGDEIVVRQDGRTMAFDRGDAMFYRLMDRRFNFVPGLTYVYTNDCDRFECRVMVLAPRSHIAVQSMFAPRIFDRFAANWDRRDDHRRFDDYDLYGAPR